MGGFQNRNKLAELFTEASPPSERDNGNTNNPGNTSLEELGGLMDSLNRGSAGGLGGLFGGASVGSALGGALGSLLDHFGQNGYGQTADSWIRTGANEPIAETELERALGAQMVEELTHHTGLPKQELLARLSRELPKAVDELTPQGTLPRNVSTSGE